MPTNPDFDKKLRRAIRHFWATRKSQAINQGSAKGVRDAGARTAVTGGRQMDGFITLVRDLLCENGLPKAQVFCREANELPGWYRPEKQWDLLVVADKRLLACIEFKSQVGSFGNNYNNRTEEAIGSATDILAAYERGAFSPASRPWLGYLMLLEDAPGSTHPVKSREPHFRIFPEFRDSSYELRYRILLTKLVRAQLYDSACFLLSDARGGRKGSYREPDPELSFQGFVASLLGRAIAFAKTRKAD
jgi:hypothetical protein